MTALSATEIRGENVRPLRNLVVVRPLPKNTTGSVSSQLFAVDLMPQTMCEVVACGPKVVTFRPGMTVVRNLAISPMQRLPDGCEVYPEPALTVGVEAAG